ncbi:NAD-dependent protein deacetylase [Modicisalibacter coralii]|uniref:NAD-dependent protein deacetylase n=1 Tax=Modicisalibacter coralii TaxID=2304602 RepID=UPI00100ABD46|nr:NAD-dependent protein deacetylase [Halomonas coralii]
MPNDTLALSRPAAPPSPSAGGTPDATTLAAFIAAHPRLLVLTGAGVSTTCGIPDYRDASGAWKRSPPVQHQAFMTSPATRQRYWARSLIGFKAIEHARPGPAHRALAALEARGHVTALVTQNVDGLHQRAGSRRVIDLHGRAEIVRCMSCGATRMRYALHEELAACNPQWQSLDAAVGPDGDADLDGLDFSTFRVLDCSRCGEGIWKPDVVFFGDSVPRDRVDAAFDALDAADALLVVGSSLMVYSGFRFARQAARAGKPIACVNRGHTRADDLYTLKVDAPVDDILAELLAHL